jgi:hypothetical protein
MKRMISRDELATRVTKRMMKTCGPIEFVICTNYIVKKKKALEVLFQVYIFLLCICRGVCGICMQIFAHQIGRHKLVFSFLS